MWAVPILLFVFVVGFIFHARKVKARGGIPTSGGGTVDEPIPADGAGRPNPTKPANPAAE